MRIHCRPVALLCLLAVTSGCGDDPPQTLFPRSEAQRLAKEFRERWVAQDIPGLVAMCGLPFNFRGRLWETKEQLEQNLAIQVPILLEEMRATEEYEVFTYHDLEEGRWPRKDNVPEGERSRRMRDLGIKSEGFVVRGFGGPGRGWQLVLNPHLTERLEARALH